LREMLGKSVIFQLQGRLFPVVSSITIVKLQPCCSASLVLVRHKARSTSPFPKGTTNMKMFEDLEKEFGGPPPGRKRDSKFVPNSLPFMPVYHPLIIDTVGSILNEYVPVQKKKLFFTPTGIKQRWEAFKMFIISTYSIAFIKRYTKPFKLRDFAVGAQKTFIEVNTALQENDFMHLRDLCTINVADALKRQFLDGNRRIYWRHIRTITPPRIVHARVAPVQEKENLFAQVTVKMHTEQILAVTDLHGRRVKGDRKNPKAVVDYVVFERHLANPYGQWKVIGKVAPPLQVKSSQLKTIEQGTQVSRT